jgi:diaminohydroxyphosphoribosylaminopyrimidine deaminase / 5-amino-6-(5-phosphoribosylamino)uracil reductase
MQTDIHIQRLKRCIRLAKKGAGFQQTNPLVGSLLFEDDQLTAEGWHARFGGAHAEVMVFDQIQPSKSYKQLYVTLEPCSHFGKTPPCADRIIAEGVKEVHIGMTDPNPLVSGRGISRLKDAGILVYVYEHILEFQSLIKPFLTGIAQQRPYIILKWAESANGFLGRANESVWLSNPFSQHKVHHIRNKVDAIFAGNQTIRTDNPRLTSRVPPFRNPCKLIMNLNGRVPSDWLIKNLTGDDFYVCHADQLGTDSLVQGMKQMGIRTTEYSRSSWMEILHWLYAHHVGTLLIEGGATVLNFLIQHNLWDEAIVIKTPSIIPNGNIEAPRLSRYPAFKESMSNDTWHYYLNGNDPGQTPYLLNL